MLAIDAKLSFTSVFKFLAHFKLKISFSRHGVLDYLTELTKLAAGKLGINSNLHLFYIQLFGIAEFMAYIILFYHLYVHNENMTTFNKQDLNINQEMSRQSINKRHQKNIISLAGQFGAFLMEISVLIIAIIFQTKTIENFVKQHLGLKLVDLYLTIGHLSKAITTITFILASPELRRYFKEKIAIKLYF